MSPIYKALADGFRPDERLTVSAWAEKHRVLSAVATKEHGPWRNERAPYLVEIMDSLSVTSEFNRVVFMAGAQVGKTEAGINWLGYVMHHAPRPTLLLFPKDDAAETNTRIRIDPLVDSLPDLKVPKKGAKEGGNTLDRKDFPGGFLAIRGANSPTNLRNLPVGNLMCDEVSAYQPTPEGDPVLLAQRRTATYGESRKEYYVSTPNVEGRCRITDLYEATDQRKYFVPCPHCGEFQVIEWENIHWDKKDLTKDPYLVCVVNGCVVQEFEKTKMLAGGEWRATVEDWQEPTTRGYHLSALYSPVGWFSWKQARDMFLEGKRKPHLMQAFVNTVLGLPWRDRGEAPPWEVLHGRRGPLLRGQIPEECLILTCAVDVQRDRLEYEIRAWGPEGRAHSVDYQHVPGDPLDVQRGPWSTLDQLLTASFDHPLGGRLQISKLVVDSSDGNSTNAVYQWTRKHPATRVAAIKGASTSTAPALTPPKLVDIEWNGRRIENGATLQTLGVDLLKTELYAHLKQPTPPPDAPAPACWYTWPSDYDENFFRGLTAEVQLVSKTGKTYWDKQFARNEPLDLAVYNRAAAMMLQLDSWSPARWARARAELGERVAEPATNLAAPRIKRIKSDYWR